MNINELLIETFDRLPDLVRSAVVDLTPEQLRWAPAPGANPVGWLVWHLTRVQDHHVSELLGKDQLWVSGPWPARFGLAPDPNNTGYGHGPEQVAAVRPAGPQDLIDYYTAVSDRTRDLLAGLTPEDLDVIVDRRWDPPVTMGVRLVSIADDDVQHVGQAAYVRGLVPEDPSVPA
jgi:DinB superfamily